MKRSFIQGSKAYWDNKPESANPYPESDVLNFTLWDEGWLDARLIDNCDKEAPEGYNLDKTV